MVESLLTPIRHENTNGATSGRAGRFIVSCSVLEFTMFSSHGPLNPAPDPFLCGMNASAPHMELMTVRSSAVASEVVS